MTVAKAFKAFFQVLTGQVPTGNTIAEVVADGTNLLSTRSSITLRSSTAESTKLFKVTVTDEGILSATEIVIP